MDTIPTTVQQRSAREPVKLIAPSTPRFYKARSHLSFIYSRAEGDEQGAKTAPKFQPFGESHDKGDFRRFRYDASKGVDYPFGGGCF